MIGALDSFLNNLEWIFRVYREQCVCLLKSTLLDATTVGVFVWLKNKKVALWTLIKISQSEQARVFQQFVCF